MQVSVLGNNDEGHNNEEEPDTNRIQQHWKHQKCWVTFFIRLQPEKPGIYRKR